MRQFFFILLIVLGFSFRLNAQVVENAGELYDRNFKRAG